MDYDIKIAEVPEQLIAVARERTKMSLISRDIQRLLDAPWALIRQRGDLRTDGHNVAVYLQWDPNGAVEVGVQIVRRFDATDLVVCSATPAGRVAATTHFGPYERLVHAHNATREWCAKHGYKPAGPAWEIYGDWNNDPQKIRTDVHVLLA
ncbi:MAG: GyrI-like domain-containing protein [Deltaproteobacteria bacterium]|nr:GyrI-like domain-containing protein [Deltaproteobacteria bacterium]